jgi:hypothetical protein
VGGGSGLDRERSEDRKQRAGAGNEDVYTQLFKREGSNGWFKFFTCICIDVGEESTWK